MSKEVLAKLWDFSKSIVNSFALYVITSIARSYLCLIIVEKEQHLSPVFQNEVKIERIIRLKV